MITPEFFNRLRAGSEPPQKQEGKISNEFFNHFRSASQLHNSKPGPREPSHFRLDLKCSHSNIMTREEIRNATVDESYIGGGRYQQRITCPKCSRHERGSCEQGNVIHEVMMVTPIFSRGAENMDRLLQASHSHHNHNNNPQQPQPQQA